MWQSFVGEFVLFSGLAELLPGVDPRRRGRGRIEPVPKEENDVLGHVGVLLQLQSLLQLSLRVRDPVLLGRGERCTCELLWELNREISTDPVPDKY